MDQPRLPDHVRVPQAGTSAGRDEMNLAEYPLGLLTDRVPPELRAKRLIRYENAQGGRVTVSGSEAYGLPTAADADVLVGLIQLTRKKNQFADPKVYFSRYELLKVLRWPDEGKYYRRLEESLNRWVGVTLYYDNTWWDNRAKRLVTAKLHVIETIVIDESPKEKGRPRSLPSSYFVWNQTFIESCQADNLKQLDLDAYFSFRSAISKRMYRFLDKRFYRSPEWSFDLREFAFDYVGVSRGYASNAGKIKEKLQPAIDELERAEFIEAMPRDRRYTKQGRDWTIRLAKKPPARPAAGKAADACRSPALAASSPLGALLRDRGVTPKIADELIREFAADRIEAKMEILGWLEEHKKGQVKEPGAWIVRAIRDDYAPPKGFASKAERVAETKAAEVARLRAEEARRLEAEGKRRRRAADHAIEAYWDRLEPGARADLEAKAAEMTHIDPDMLRSPLRRTYLKTIRDAYIRTLLPGPPNRPGAAAKADHE